MASKNLTVQLLEELIADSVKVSKPTKTSIRDLPETERKAYKAQKQAERRKALKERAESGSLKFDADTTRDALADAAIMLLASGAEGSKAIQAYLEKVFHDQVGAPLTITARAKSGQLKPKLIRFAAKAS